MENLKDSCYKVAPSFSNMINREDGKMKKETDIIVQPFKLRRNKTGMLMMRRLMSKRKNSCNYKEVKGSSNNKSKKRHNNFLHSIQYKSK